MIIYIAGPITGSFDYREKFKAVETKLTEMGHSVISPAYLPVGLGGCSDYLHICYAMIDKSDAVCFLKGYEDSKGSLLELEYAKENYKEIFVQDDKRGYVKC